MTLPIFPSLTSIVGRGFPVTRAAKWSGTDQSALSGKRVRTSYQSYPTYTYTMPINVLRTSGSSTEYQLLQAFINSLLGTVGAFLYDDVNDDAATNAGFGIGDGASTTFQLTRSFGGFTEPVFFQNVINNVKVNGTPTSAYTIGTLGQIVFNSAPALGALLTWTGTFSWCCRFDDEAIDFENFMQYLFRVKKLTFSTEKLP